MATRKIKLLMYNTMKGKPNEETFFISENDVERQVERKDIFDTIKYYYKLAHAGKIELGEDYYFNSKANLVVKELIVKEL